MRKNKVTKVTKITPESIRKAQENYEKRMMAFRKSADIAAGKFKKARERAERKEKIREELGIPKNNYLGLERRPTKKSLNFKTSFCSKGSGIGQVTNGSWVRRYKEHYTSI